MGLTPALGLIAPKAVFFFLHDAMALPQLNEKIFSLSPTFVYKEADPGSEKVPFTLKGVITYYNPVDGGRFPANVLMGECAQTNVFTGSDGRQYMQVQCEGWDFRNHVFWSEWVRTFPKGYVALADEGIYWVRDSYRGKSTEQIQDEQTIISIRAEFDTYTGVIAPDRIYKEQKADGTKEWKVAWNSGYSQWWTIFQAMNIASKVTYSTLTKEEYTKLGQTDKDGTAEPETLIKQLADIKKELATAQKPAATASLLTTTNLFYVAGGIAALIIGYVLFRQSQKR